MLATTVLMAGWQVDRVPSADPVAGDGDAQPALVDTDGLVEPHQFLLPTPDGEVTPHLDAPWNPGLW